MKSLQHPHRGKSCKFSMAILHAIRIIIGVLFLFSGFVKAVDPLGTVYKIEDYLIAFDGIFIHLFPLAFPAALLLIAIELILGFNLLLRVKLKFSSWAALVLMVFMTGLTLYIAINNPVSDCGCFGDAIKISNWNTFYKDVVITVLITFLLIYQKTFRKILQSGFEWVLIAIFILISGGFMAYNLCHLPIIDFRPYKVGVNIPDAMAVPAGAQADVYEYTFTYEKDGVEADFALENLPDSSWTFVSQESKLITKGYQPSIYDFEIVTLDYDDVTYDILQYTGVTYLLVAYDLNLVKAKAADKLQRFLRKHPAERAYVLTASSSEQIESFEQKHQWGIPYYKVDPISLKTMIRANPGVVKLENGTIEGKWNWRQIGEW